MNIYISCCGELDNILCIRAEQEYVLWIRKEEELIEKDFVNVINNLLDIHGKEERSFFFLFLLEPSYVHSLLSYYRHSGQAKYIRCKWRKRRKAENDTYCFFVVSKCYSWHKLFQSFGVDNGDIMIEKDSRIDWTLCFIYRNNEGTRSNMISFFLCLWREVYSCCAPLIHQKITFRVRIHSQAYCENSIVDPVSMIYSFVWYS